MSQPSFSSYLKMLSSLLRHKGVWLQEESQDLARLCQLYSKQLNLSHENRKVLLMAAYCKNLGALYISDYLLEHEFRDHRHMMTALSPWFVESVRIAQEADLAEVATILAQYHQRKVPQDQLARIFQVLNTWVACQQERGWRHPMSEREARVILEQRARLKWSDPLIVRHFIHFFDQSGEQFRRPRPTPAIAVTPEEPATRLTP
jgi:response regulator RpfG family c-di-GMP phosphodiesterase